MSQEIENFENVPPFASIRHEDENGEYWLARELMPLLGYKAENSWRDFSGVIERARMDMINIDQDPDVHAHKSSSMGMNGKPLDDYRLSRYGCYMTAMNGDYRKPEISAARAYFATNTRKWEAYQELSERERVVLLARQVIELDNQLSEKIEQLAIAMPKAEEHDAFMTSDGNYSWNAVAKSLYNDESPMGRNLLLRKLRELGVVLQPRSNERALPKQKYQDLKWFDVVIHEPFGSNTTYVTPLGISEIYKLLKKAGEDVTDPNGEL